MAPPDHEGERGDGDGGVDGGVAEFGVGAHEWRGGHAALEPFAGVGGDRDEDQHEDGEHGVGPGQLASRGGPQRAEDEEQRGEGEQYDDGVYEQDVGGQAVERGHWFLWAVTGVQGQRTTAQAS
ncbi:hypothetical protein QRX50_35815 [Amycolatopsis carbonis]|uniref:Uncharacterized protein n=1 Tax=Amycolatopsis carbonis TaxID=715471 RepID=A0A9Y2ICK0_9PSEU|nr:hypothetical protein [Amycolatopsis sp. 2-15]WIX76771.1 hypothetical protein QRX50_35815 [Amycolatopsis sp. 2-15]